MICAINYFDKMLSFIVAYSVDCQKNMKPRALIVC